MVPSVGRRRELASIGMSWPSELTADAAADAERPG